MSKALQIAKEVLDAVGGKANVTGNDICMTRLRIKTEDPSLVDTDQLTATRGVLGIVQRGKGGIEVVFGPGKVEDVHEALADLTGIESSETGFSDGGPSRMDVIVSSHAETADEDTAVDDDEDDDLSSVESLVSLLDADDGTNEKKPEPSCGDAAEDVEPVSVLVLNGPNINMLGIREPGIYGSESYTDLLQLCQDTAAEVGFDRCTCYQSNHEGDLVDAIQDAMGKYDGIVINPGAYTHTSIAILDAAKAVRMPIVEVHISKVEEREEFRQVSYIRQACFETITGMGINGYRKAILDLAEKLDL